MNGGLFATLDAAGLLAGPVQAIGAPFNTVVEEIRAAGEQVVTRGFFDHNPAGPPDVVLRTGFVVALGAPVPSLVPPGPARLDELGRVVVVDRFSRVRRYDSLGARDGALDGVLPKSRATWSSTAASSASRRTAR